MTPRPLLRAMHRFEHAPAVLAIALIAASCALIGWLDYATGDELRIFPLYFCPVAMSAWRFGQKPAYAVASACALIWFVTNMAAGMTNLPLRIPLANALVQWLTFLALGWLLAATRALLDRERELARTDQLTGVMNLLGFRERAELEWRRAQRTGLPLAVACLDLDRFKEVNDTRGHGSGDALLKEIGAALSKRARATDVVGRIGGDEFIILMPDTGVAGANALLESIRREIARVATVQALPVTASAGAVVSTGWPQGLEAMIREADFALYTAKQQGRNRVIVTPL